MNALVVYESRYGSTQQYAEWIADEADADVVAAEELSPEALGEYDVIVFGGWIHAGKLQGADFIIDNWNTLMEKRVAVFSVSGKSPDSESTKEAIQSSLPDEFREGIECFSVPGRLIYSNLRLLDRLLITVAGHRGVAFDRVERANVEPIVAFIRSVSDQIQSNCS